MSFNPEAVRIVRLLSGEDLLGLLSGKGDQYFLELPFVIGIVNDPRTNNPTVHLAPFFHLMDSQTLELQGSSIIFSYKPNEDVREKYKQIYLQMTSGLVLPPDAKGLV